MLTPGVTRVGEEVVLAAAVCAILPIAVATAMVAALAKFTPDTC